jgi:ankyrin repeat protein
MGSLWTRITRALSLCGCCNNSSKERFLTSTIKNDDNTSGAGLKSKERSRVSALRFIKPRLKKSSSKLGFRRHLLRNAVSESNLTLSILNQSILQELNTDTNTSAPDSPTNRSSMSVGIPIDEETGAYIIVTGETPLHLALHEQPPLTFVAKLIEHCPERISESNVLGMTPLHIAAGSGANPNVLECLVTAFPAAVGIKDHKSRTPLHLICMNTQDCDTGNSYGDKVKGPFLPAIRILLNVKEPIINVEDVYGKSALEYAIDSDASVHVVKTLHKASEQEWKSKQQWSPTTLAHEYSKDSQCTFDTFDAQPHVALSLVGSVSLEGQSPKPHAIPLQRYAPAMPPSLLNLVSEPAPMSVLSLKYTRTRRRGALDMRGSFYASQPC